MLKMAYCYLGMGLFGNRVVESNVGVGDMDAAKKVLDYIETGAVWEGMEKRRKMLFYHAKAEYYRQMNNVDIARVHAREAEKLARKNKWTKELPNISSLLDKLGSSSKRTARESDMETVEKLLKDCLTDVCDDSDDDSEHQP